MKINNDFYYKIGKSHKVCQDYTISGEACNEKYVIPYMVVCDGCSSSNHSEAGAVFLAFAFKRIMDGLPDILSFDNTPLGNDVEMKNLIYTYLKLNLSDIQNCYNLDSSVLDATLIAIFIVNNTVYEFVYGDGCIVKKYKDGRIRGDFFTYESGAPYYLSYRIDDERNIAYHKQFGSGLINHDIYINNEIKKTYWNIDSFNSMISYPVDNIDYIMIASDGIFSFVDIENRNLHVVEILPNIINIKNYNGEFLTRRMNMFNSECLKNGTYHYDDLSINYFKFGDYNEKPNGLPQ